MCYAVVRRLAADVGLADARREFARAKCDGKQMSKRNDDRESHKELSSHPSSRGVENKGERRKEGRIREKNEKGTEKEKAEGRIAM